MLMFLRTRYDTDRLTLSFKQQCVLKSECYLALYHSLPTEGDAGDAAAALHFRLG